MEGGEIYGGVRGLGLDLWVGGERVRVRLLWGERVRVRLMEG